MTPKQIKFMSELFTSSSISEAIALEEVSIQMQVGFSDAVEELLQIIRNNRVSAQVKINAIDCLFRNAKPIMEEVDILNRLQAVEAKIQEEGEEDDS